MEPVHIGLPKTSGYTASLSPRAYMDNLCVRCGGYDSFFWKLFGHYIALWVVVIVAPLATMEHHTCQEVKILSWVSHVVFALFQAWSLRHEWRLSQQLVSYPQKLPKWHDAWLSRTLLWRINIYLDVVFIFIARDCGSSLWVAALVCFVVSNVVGQLLLHSCFAMSDCDHQLPHSFGFVLFDFLLVNSVVRQQMPALEDSTLAGPFSRTWTLRGVDRCIQFEKSALSDVVQAGIQLMFLNSDEGTLSWLVILSVSVSLLHAMVTIASIAMEICGEVKAGRKRSIDVESRLKWIAGESDTVELKERFTSAMIDEETPVAPDYLPEDLFFSGVLSLPVE
eukprot:GEMP01014793.1.p1 GENE.GEMP01014793.1~~GEMP01014793.1.p1  ORF type:complete len:337 (+),score=69.13 GEMP01014793.1:280-1290(+)